MSAEPSLVAAEPLAAFEKRYGDVALFLAYARNRRTQFALRQGATAIGGLILWALVSPVAALVAVCLALLGEGVEIGVLTLAQRRIAAGQPLAQVRGWAAAAALFQAATIAVCVQILLVAAPMTAAEMLALCFLMAASVNAGFALSHFPVAAKAKLWVFGLCAAGHLAHGLWYNAGLASDQIFVVLQMAMLAYMAYTFIAYALKAWHRRIAKERDLLIGAAQLADVNRDLAASQREMRELSIVARKANDSVIISDRDGRITWVNEAFTRHTGYSFDEARGKTPPQLLDGPDSDQAVAEAVNAARASGQPLRTEVLNYTKGGRKIWVDINLVPIRTPDGAVDGFISIERDVTDARAQAAELEEAKARAEAGARAKSVFLATMSHEIRTPLNGIIGMAELLSDAPLDEEEQVYAKTILDSSEALLKIINDILELSRLDADKLTLEDKPFSLAACLRGVGALMRPTAREKGLFLDVTHETSLPECVCADEGRLRQILVNLLGNALKFTETGGVSVTVAAKSVSGGWTIAVRVRDTGIGVPPDRAEAIFEEFEQADAETTRRFGGTGLGLPISRALARRMGGDITFEPVNGPGSCFVLTVTLGRMTAAAQKALPLRTRQESPPLHVLLAEDNATNRLLIARFLQDQPVTLTMAENGRRAVEIVEETAPDVVLMDMAMPELDGLQATRAIREMPIAQPQIVAITANAFASDRAACAAVGMDDFLTKPLRKADLIAALIRAHDGEKPLSKSRGNGLSHSRASKGPDTWTSPPASGTTNGKSIRSSGR